MFAVFLYKDEFLVRAYSSFAFHYWWNEGLEPVINHKRYGKWCPDAVLHAEEFFPPSHLDYFSAIELANTPML